MRKDKVLAIPQKREQSTVPAVSRYQFQHVAMLDGTDEHCSYYEKGNPMTCSEEKNP